MERTCREGMASPQPVDGDDKTDSQAKLLSLQFWCFTAYWAYTFVMRTLILESLGIRLFLATWVLLVPVAWQNHECQGDRYRVFALNSDDAWSAFNWYSWSNHMLWVNMFCYNTENMRYCTFTPSLLRYFMTITITWAWPRSWSAQQSFVGVQWNSINW